MDISSIGQQVIGGLFGLGLSGINDARQISQQRNLNDMSEAMQRRLYDYQMEKQFDMWNKTNYKAQVAKMKEAGLSPGLMYGKGGGGGVTIGGGMPGGGGGAASGHAGEVMQGMGLQLMSAQVRLAEAQAKKAEVEATKTAGVDTANVIADTELKVLEQVIRDYTGKEMKDYYNVVKSPSRMVEAETYLKELEAKQGIAGNIYELWREGKLKEMSLEQLEQLIVGNAKSRAERSRILKDIDMIDANLKGKNIANALDELELKLLQRTGVDRNSNSFLRIIARFFADIVGHE